MLLSVIFVYLCVLNNNLTNIKKIMEITMYDNILQLPLFQGLCKDDFTTIIERVKLHFTGFKQGETIFRQEEPCRNLVFLLSGEVEVQTKNETHQYILTETFTGPHIIEPYSLFGMKTSFTATYRAKTDVKMLYIDKSYIHSELYKYEIFRINFFNLLSNRCQSTTQKLWNNHIGSLNEKFVNFFLLRCIKPSGEKNLSITMEELASLIDETRINVSHLLNDLQKKDLVQLRRKEIFIPALEKLVIESL